MLQRLFARHLDQAETVTVRSAGEAVQALGHSPANGLVVNAPWHADGQREGEKPGALPYETPAFYCWVPSTDEAVRALGIVRYLVKPVTRDVLLAALDGLGDKIGTVLLVDDQPQALQLFARLIASAGREYTVLLAGDGPRALHLMRRRRPDAVLLDLVMPDMDGFAVLREKSHDAAIRDIPVIVVSSKDPMGEPTVTDALTIAPGGGLTAGELVSCIQVVSQVLCPSNSGHAPAPPESRGG